MFNQQFTDTILQLLSSKRRDRFLSGLGLALATVARDSYRKEPREREASSLESINEMLIVIFKQIAASLAGSQNPYPDDVFLATLMHHARDEKPAEALRWSINRVLEDLEPSATS
jgi:hypothetical protein